MRRRSLSSCASGRPKFVAVITATAPRVREHVDPATAVTRHVEGGLAPERSQPPQVAVLRLHVDPGVGSRRLLDPRQRQCRRATTEVELAEREQSTGRQQQPSGRSGLPQRRDGPLGALDSERLEQLPLREGRQRLANRTLHRDAGEHDTRRAIAETEITANRQVESEPRPVLARVMRSSLPGEDAFQSSHSRQELIVTSSSSVISRLRGSTSRVGDRSGSNSPTVTPTSATRPCSIAMPSSIPTTVFVHERVFLSVPASPSPYCSTRISPLRETSTLVISP